MEGIPMLGDSSLSLLHDAIGQDRSVPSMSAQYSLKF